MRFATKVRVFFRLLMVQNSYTNNTWDSETTNLVVK